MKHYNHIIRFCIVLIIILIGFFAVRGGMVPESFGIYRSYIYGYYRGDSEAEQADRYPLFKGSEKCNTCHTEQLDLWSGGAHAIVACEACHGHWQAHNNNTKQQVVKDRTDEACMLCHRQLKARPAKFPQIASFPEHVAEQEETLEKGMMCVDCHDAHDPMGITQKS